MSFYLPGTPLIATLVTTIIGLLSWGFWRYQKNSQSSVRIEWLDLILVGFAALFIVILVILWISLFYRLIP